jgi:hypothetical protein
LVAPQGPACGAIGEAVLDDQSDGRVDDAAGIVAARFGEVGHVGVEVLATAGAVVLGVEHDDVARPPRERIAEIVEGPIDSAIAVRTVSTAGTGPSPVIAAAETEIGLGQVLDASDALGGVGSVFAGPGHDTPPGRRVLPGNTSANGALFIESAR